MTVKLTFQSSTFLSTFYNELPSLQRIPPSSYKYLNNKNVFCLLIVSGKKGVSDDLAIRIEISPEKVYFGLQICHIRKFCFALKQMTEMLIDGHIP